MENLEEQQQTIERAEILQSKKIHVKPIYREGTWLGKGHDGEFMYTGCKLSIDLPINKKRRQLESILTREEQAFFEKELFLEPGDLSIYKKKDNYWHKFRVDLEKDGLSLDLSDPVDNLRWRVLLKSPQFAPSLAEQYNSPEYKFVLVDEGEEVEQRVKKADRKKEAYKWLGKIEGSTQKMYDFLRVYGKQPAKDSKRDFLYAEIDKLIDEHIDSVLAIIGDSDYETRIFIEDAIKAGAIVKAGKSRYELPGGDKIGSSTPEVIEFLKDNANQDILLKIKNQIEVSE